MLYKTSPTTWLKHIFLSRNCTVQNNKGAKGSSGKGHMSPVSLHSRNWLDWEARIKKISNKGPPLNFSIQPFFYHWYTRFSCANLLLKDFQNFFETAISPGHLCLMSLATPDLSQFFCQDADGQREHLLGCILSRHIPLCHQSLCSSQQVSSWAEPASADTRGLSRHLFKLRNPNSCWLMTFFCE